MGQIISANKSPLVVNFEGKSALIQRHVKFEDAIAAVHSAKTFELLEREFYFTAHLPRVGDEELEITEDVWAKVIERLDSVTIRVLSDEVIARRIAVSSIPSYETATEGSPRVGQLVQLEPAGDNQSGLDQLGDQKN
ncbi:hypothetical protein CYLTODRAFT_488914 [Cylindrobasidium torrendii FP15055 ss-10]|uniref:Uncharacterized protein n=1 Tax=Cylindrobasidium torrendii FP15055 ss-10 TaxID=1314674 RepID=A0A0D7BFV1_9AGAR|nr:hypothetical protein CYLTODRAFT_488914 [Cylindrobasidium torrendii FP15055 ss-10]